MNRSRLLAIGWTLGILLACSIPGNDIPKIDLNLLQPDKVVHFSMFLGFGWLWLSAIPSTRRLKFPLIIGAGVLYAVGTEIYQGLLPWDRTPDVADAAANILGLCSAAGLYRWRERRRGA